MKFNTGIIGYGKLGKNLALILNQKKLLTWIVDKSKNERNSALSQFPDIKIYHTIQEIDILPDVIIICINDAHIENISNELAYYFQKRLYSKIVIHCSGSLDSSILYKCKNYGAYIASCHPYQTFFTKSEKLFKNIPWGIESDNCLDLVFKFVKKLDGKPYSLDSNIPDGKYLYHSSAVAASNFLNSTLILSGQIADIAKIPKSEIIPPIVKTSIENIFNSFNDNTYPLTGPIIRGDIETLKKHIESLKDFPHLKRAYIYFSLATAEIALNNKIIKKQKFVELQRFLLYLL